MYIVKTIHATTSSIIVCYAFSVVAHTDPKDVARVESKTVICTDQKRDTIPTPAEGVEGKLGKWISPYDMEAAYMNRFPGCMRGE